MNHEYHRLVEWMQCAMIYNKINSCSYISNYIGNPYEGYRPECTIDSECSNNLACITIKCQNPCTGRCAIAAICQVVNHFPFCTCLTGFTGDPYSQCVFNIQNKRMYKLIPNIVFNKSKK